MLNDAAIRAGATALLLAALIGATGGSAHAQGGAPSQGASVSCVSGNCPMSVWTEQSASAAKPKGAAPVSAASAQGSGSAPSCVVDLVPGGPVAGADGQKYTLSRRQCGNGYPEGLLNGPALPDFAPVGQPTPTAAAVDPQAVALQAEGELRLPRPVVVMSPSTFQVVRVPTWLWLNAAAWSPQSATVQVPGAVVTATATPVSVTWDPGDGSAAVVCTGAGTPWHWGVDPAAASSDCGHVYEQSSAGAAGGVFTVTATAHWQVAWHGAGRAGAFPDLTSTATVPVRVEEVQATVDRPTR